MSRNLTSILLALCLAAAGCGGAGVDAAPTSTTQSTTVEATTSTAPVTSTSADASTPSYRGPLDWFVAALNSGVDPTVADIEKRFSPAFLAQVPAETLLASTPAIFAGAEPPFAVESVKPVPGGNDDLEVVARVVASNGSAYDVNIAVEAKEPHLIEGLFVQPHIEFDPTTTMAKIQTGLDGVAANSTLGVYDVTDGQCSPLEGFHTEETMPLGSTFKLWILAELAHQVEQGTATWDETLAVTDEHRSSPDGEVFQVGTGTELTLQRFAELMISISDNSATDHLLARLGRANVEAAMTRIGVADPSRNIPFLSTGAMFQLKFIAEPPNSADYRLLDEAGRAAMLDEITAAPLPWVAGVDAVDLVNADGVSFDQPRGLDIEWFATPDDLCLTLVHLAALAETPGLEPVAGILAVNPGAGLPFDRERWPTIRFKGGSEPGVVAGAWWLERSDGRRFVIAGGASDPDVAFSEVEAVVLIASAIELIS